MNMNQKPGIRKTLIADLTMHPDNPRHGDIGAIVESIEQNGWFGTLVAQCSTGHVLAGNHRMQAASHLEIDKVPVHWVDVDDAAALRILLADNRTSDLATNDDDILAELLAALVDTDDGLAGTGYDGDDLDELLGDSDQQWRPDLDTTSIDLQGEYQLVIVCLNEQAQREALDDLHEQGYTVRASLL